MSFTPNELVYDRYLIEAKLGEGGMGEVYLATDKSNGENIALKALNSDHISNEVSRLNFKEEFKVMHELNHPNIVRAIELHENEDLLFFTMEHVSGRSLSKLIYEEPCKLDFRTSLDYLHQVARGLFAAHEQGFIHQDIKPDNVLISEDGNAKLIDFGLVTRSDSSTNTNAGSDPIGTLYYMPPEQFQGKAIDHRADIYSFGILAFELFAKQRPFPTDVPYSLFVEHVIGTMPSIRSIDKSLPKWLEIFILISVEKDPAHRYKSVAVFLEMFEDMKKRADDPSLLGRVSDWIGFHVGL